VLSALLGERIELTGAGRTDTGVHASYYIAHFDYNGDRLGDHDDFLYHANSMLPPDIALRSIHPVAPDAHARFDAREREYTYYILPFKDPFRTATAWQYTVPLEIDAMNEAAAHLLHATDFTSFAKLGSDNRTNICHISKAEWTLSPLSSRQRPQADEGSSPPDAITAELRFTIRADRFLRNMVRAIVGTLVDVGRGKLTPAQFADIIAARDLSLSSSSAPAHGLVLSDISYY
jgi:tRNA pseudouridine38-40 synthase